ncbi:MAG: hypothetical protein JWO89_2203 [Verrucomicrobiaceae bacterium]|nr:hypothetical protein [Verrucomicrobiaceae bacterium]
MSDRTAILLQRIEQGYRNDAARLRSMGQDFQFTLESAKRVGDTPGTTDQWKQNLQREWTELDAVVQRMNTQMEEIQAALATDDRPRLLAAINAWNALMPAESALDETLSRVHAHLGELDPLIRRDWAAHERLIKNHLQMFQATIQALRTKLSLLNDYADLKVDPQVKLILENLPPDLPSSLSATEEYVRRYQEAAMEIQHDQHKNGNLTDTIKAMFLWVDSPEERLREKGVISKMGQ